MIRPETHRPAPDRLTSENLILPARGVNAPDTAPDTAPIKIPADTPAVSKEKILASPEKIKSLLSSLPSPSSEKSLSEKLKSSRLSVEDLLETISFLMESADCDSTRLRAAETALKVHGLLTQSVSPIVPTVVINISGSRNDGCAVNPNGCAVNPILLPRELKEEIKTSASQIQENL